MSDSQVESVIHDVYLPFRASELRPHFLSDADKQVLYYQRSAQRYQEFSARPPNGPRATPTDIRFACQIQKDERFWTATALKRLVESTGRPDALCRLLKNTVGASPPLKLFSRWEACLEGEVELILEAVLPAPKSYVNWLQRNVTRRHLVPYVLRAAETAGGGAREGPTHVDAIIVNRQTGFALIIEAKVLSDVSGFVSFDVFRNQLARNLDVLLEDYSGLGSVLAARRPDSSLFMLLTPTCFRENPTSRLYGWLFEDYRKSSAAIARDLPHRAPHDLIDLGRRMGWITFEEIAGLVPNACPWLRGIA